MKCLFLRSVQQEFVRVFLLVVQVLLVQTLMIYLMMEEAEELNLSYGMENREEHSHLSNYHMVIEFERTL